MQITRQSLGLMRDEYANDAQKRGSVENDVEFIKISALIANNAGFMVYNSFPMVYEELHLRNMFANLQMLFVDSLVTTNFVEDGKFFFVIDWSPTSSPTSSPMVETP